MRKQSKECSLVVSCLGKVAKGIKCSVIGCSNDAIRSLPTEKVKAAGLKMSEVRRAYLCREHYKEFKKNTKQDRILEKWRHGVRE
jgi:hypothetical protein